MGGHNLAEARSGLVAIEFVVLYRVCCLVCLVREARRTCRVRGGLVVVEFSVLFVLLNRRCLDLKKRCK